MISKGADVIIVIDLRLPITSLSVHHITGHVFCIHAFFRVGVLEEQRRKFIQDEREMEKERRAEKLIMVRSMMESQANLFKQLFD